MATRRTEPPRDPRRAVSQRRSFGYVQCVGGRNRSTSFGPLLDGTEPGTTLAASGPGVAGPPLTETASTVQVGSESRRSFDMPALQKELETYHRERPNLLSDSGKLTLSSGAKA